MVNETGEKFEDNVVPKAIPLIQAREDGSIPILGAVNVMGMIPPSTKPNVDDAVFGVATWEKWDPKSDRFSIYVRGLSDGYKETPPPAAASRPSNTRRCGSTSSVAAIISTCTKRKSSSPTRLSSGSTGERPPEINPATA